MAATLGFRAQSLGIPVKGLVSRQPVFILDTYDRAAKKEWLPLLKSRVENADSPILGAKTVVSSHRRLIFHAHHFFRIYILTSLHQKTNLINLLAVPEREVTNAHNFPIFGSKEELSRMPPTYFVGAGCDPCIDELELFANLLREAGVTVKVRIYQGVPHGFHAHHVLQAARDEMNDTAEGVNWLIGLVGQ